MTAESSDMVTSTAIERNASGIRKLTPATTGLRPVPSGATVAAGR
jgi:hypothetical protein